MIPENTIVIHHQDGVCSYSIKAAKACIVEGEFDVEIKTFENPDCVLAFAGALHLYIEGLELGTECAEDFIEEEFFEEIGWDTEEETKWDNIFHIYLGEHFALDNNKLRLARIGSDEIQIEWTCDAEDFNYYGEEAKRNKLEISCWCPLVSSEEFSEFSRNG